MSHVYQQSLACADEYRCKNNARALFVAGSLELAARLLILVALARLNDDVVVLVVNARTLVVVVAVVLSDDDNEGFKRAFCRSNILNALPLTRYSSNI